ncbi:MAG: hypothetical protein A3H57_00855 [Candidatus Taylorbacteria bacterium RIFCSPLOWO2_02_FULL_43_11]|uniref:Uncharacterized protein n=1 Tax=Candidatus Taylorbacteria bacterium RIFCSPHIGHO2_02_FULL_43_32b TaxID=1802306 RepID=A0A1G2MKV9_9BACT|nr:MAG: hypothetical protein A2743_03530 [Candidatus Taylorbacteria bacterium RIFCSPHIGHO2_01_FULL_43_47]OHA24507.1 MAG: hypothetical protein A3C72_00980 [Candidatus Taylorbacteria bacterium RIFCSPHIGHO2_02_FULL_43_32b]OHA31821.1 MAG: hypothetical protein A3B08_01275 [Candidatus Taylorbacteria bacterium RIFCSPLOWO2_01_FULL_43_44]OHA36701.1 MAG: hypothetical protein A3H57_00855 [Candidatus Taylorbacteria bacterium RIFCSPLOWO2_02_FULL_43_11]
METKDNNLKLPQIDRKLAHDIRNSLAVIKMDSETALLTENLASDVKKILRQIGIEVDNINKMFD